MSHSPTGRIVLTPLGRDLVIPRTFRAPIEDVWASLTEPERTARWFGPWYGEPGPGRKIRYRMVFEQGGDTAEPSEMTIEACEPPRHLAVSAVNAYGGWRLEVHLSERNGLTELVFTQHLDDQTDAGSIGPGWEYYLDNLVASRDGTERPDFNDYYPAMKAHYERPDR